MSCNFCKKACRKNQAKLLCITCKCNYHQKCTSLTSSQYKDSFTGEKPKSFVCTTCNDRVSKDTEIFVSHIDCEEDESPPLFVTYSEEYALPDPIKIDQRYNSLSANYCSTDDLNKNLVDKTANDLFVLHYNIVSLVAHIDSIISMISEMKKQPDLICISESRLKDDKIEWQSALVAQ